MFVLGNIVQEPKYSRSKTTFENGRRAFEVYVDTNEISKREAVREYKTNINPLSFVCAQKNMQKSLDSSAGTTAGTMSAGSSLMLKLK